MQVLTQGQACGERCQPGRRGGLRAPQAGVELLGRLLAFQVHLPVPELRHLGILLQLHSLGLHMQPGLKASWEEMGTWLDMRHVQ